MLTSIPLAAPLLLSLFLQAKEFPEYDWWSQCKAGSWVKIKVEGEQQGVKVSIDTTHTLVELTKEKAVVERKVKMTVGGMAQPEETEKEDVKAGEDKNPTTVDKEGDEEVEVSGKKIKCHFIQGTQKDGTKMKVWVTKDIPGGILKGEMTPAGAGTLKLTASSWEKK